MASKRVTASERTMFNKIMVIIVIRTVVVSERMTVINRMVVSNGGQWKNDAYPVYMNSEPDFCYFFR